MSNEFEYYVIGRKSDKAYPMVDPKEGSKHTKLYIGDNFSEFHEKQIPDPQSVEFVFSDPVPRKPVIGDYFSEPESIVSKKIADVIKPMNIKGIQLIPAIIESNKGDMYKDLYWIYIYHYIEAMDKKKTKFELRKSGVYFFDRFALDEKILSEIPLEERLVFKLKEKDSIKLYHRSVVDAIVALNPEGIQFTKVEDWVK
jgi:hypothetical protein